MSWSYFETSVSLLTCFQKNRGFSADDVISSHLSNIILSHSSPSLILWFIYIYFFFIFTELYS